MLETPCQSQDSTIAAMPEALNDLINHVEIQANDCICHPQYAPWQLSSTIGNRFAELPQQIQQKYLSLQLRDFIHSIYFSGASNQVLAAAATPEIDAPSPPIVNNTSRGINRSFYDSLHQANNGIGYFDPGWTVLRQLSNDQLLAQKEGLTLYIDPQHHLQNPTRSHQVGDQILLRLPRNRLENGFYIAMGNAGWEDLAESVTAINLYFHVNAEGAIELMQMMTQQLNALQIPFTFRVLYDASEYGRYDAGILQIQADRYSQIRPLLTAIYQVNRIHFQPLVPLFTKRLAPGVGLAEVPPPIQSQRQDFGLHRCQLVANGLLITQSTEEHTAADRLSAIGDQFEQQGLTWEQPYLNPQSEDVYALFAL